MKKLIILLIIIVSASYGQNTGVPGKDYFPFMSFWDFAVYQNHPRQSTCTSAQYASAMQQNSRLYYYSLLESLGLTNIVSDFDLINTLNMSDYYGNIKFLDMDFSWAGDDFTPFEPGRYLKATGNNPNKFAHQIGGTWDMSWSPDDKNYGFGTTSFNSRWAMDPTKQPSVSPDLTGDNIGDDTPPINGGQVRYAEWGEDLPGGTLFYGTIDAGHFPHKGIPYYLSFFIRGDQKELAEEVDPNAVVLKIYVIEGGSIYQKPYNKNIGTEEPNSTEEDPTYFLEEPFEITGEDLIPTSGSYGWFTTPSFQIPGDVNITYYAVWTGAASIYCDRMIMFNEFYDIMFNPTQKSNPVTPPNFGEQISKKYETTYPDLHSTYVDEPPLLAAEAFAKINYLVDLEMGSYYPAMELNGAIGPHTEWGMRFEQKYGTSPSDEKYKRKYLLYNVYPFRQNLTTSQTDVQAALDELVNYRFIGDDPELLPYQFLGLRPAVRASKLYDDDPDDIPWISILQVHAEHKVYEDGGQYKIDWTATNMRRAPTRDEIFVQGNMALAYGAKGFMVYMVPTWNAIPGEVEGDTVWNTYGLFDQFQNAYAGIDGSGLVQHPCSTQVPNTRYNAVHDLIEDTKKIDDIILGLNWQNARSWNHSYSGTPTWIENIDTKIPGESSFDATKYVETGEFVENGQTAEGTDERYVYIVNKRCNLQGNDNSAREISFNIARFKDYVNYKITDLKSNIVYYKTYYQPLTLNLPAGGGTLLLIEPVVHSGGVLLESESLEHPVIVKSDLILSPGKTLGIHSDCEMTFLNSAKLDVSSGYLNIIGSQQNKVTLDFVSRNWTAGNGINAGGAAVVIENAIIKNASAGISAWNPSSLSISNTTIENCWFGVAVQSRPLGWIYLDKVKVLNCDARGVTLDNANLEIKDSKISGSTYGVRIVDGAAYAGLRNSSFEYGLDTLFDNSVGLYSYNSDVDFGWYWAGNVQGINNLFSENLTHFIAWEGSVICAQHNFWDDIDDIRIEVDEKSVVDTYPELLEGSDNPLTEGEDELLSNNPKLSNGEGNTVKEKVGLIRQLIKAKNTKRARSICIDILENNSDDELIPVVLRLFRQTFGSDEITDFKNYLKLGNNSRKGSIARGLIQVQDALFKENPIVSLDSVASEYTKKLPAEQALYKKAVYQLMVQRDRKGAKISRLKLETDFPESHLLADLNLLLSDTMTARNSTINQGLGKANSEGVVTVEYDYNLYNNYPNPFNPETVIKFSLKEKSNVTLTVYNIAGQKVTELVSGEMEKGVFEKRFNGTKLSSGVYIFRLSAQSLESTTNFSKTTKALLLK